MREEKQSENTINNWLMQVLSPTAMNVGQLVPTLVPQTSKFVNDFPLFILATDAPFGGTKDGSRVVESPLESILRSK